MFPDMPCTKRFYKDKKATVHWSAARNQERVSSGGQTAYEPLANRTFCSPTGLHGVSLVRASEGSFRAGAFDALGGAIDGRLLGEPFRRPSALLGPAPPRRPAVRRPYPTRPRYVRVLDSTDLLNLSNLLLRQFKSSTARPRSNHLLEAFVMVRFLLVWRRCPGPRGRQEQSAHLTPANKELCARGISGVLDLKIC